MKIHNRIKTETPRAPLKENKKKNDIEIKKKSAGEVLEPNFDEGQIKIEMVNNKQQKKRNTFNLFFF